MTQNHRSLHNPDHSLLETFALYPPHPLGAGLAQYPASHKGKVPQVPSVPFQQRPLNLEFSVTCSSLPEVPQEGAGGQGTRQPSQRPMCRVWAEGTGGVRVSPISEVKSHFPHLLPSI